MSSSIKCVGKKMSASHIVFLAIYGSFYKLIEREMKRNIVIFNNHGIVRLNPLTFTNQHLKMPSAVVVCCK